MKRKKITIQECALRNYKSLSMKGKVTVLNVAREHGLSKKAFLARIIEVAGFLTGKNSAASFVWINGVKFAVSPELGVSPRPSIAALGC